MALRKMLHTRRRFAACSKFSAMLILLMLVASVASAQVRLPTDSVYFPGYVNSEVPLALFVPPHLSPACVALQKGNLNVAEKAFAREIQQRPNNLAAHIGLLQAVRGRRDALLPQYQQEAARTGSATDEFKLGLLAWYLLGQIWQDHSKEAQSEKQKLKETARRGLTQAYQRTLSSVAGFTLVSAYGYLGANGGAAVELYEDMLRHLVGDSTYRFYQQTKQNKWTGQQPPVPKLSHNELLILQEVVGELYSENSVRYGRGETRIVNGKMRHIDKGVEPYTPPQQKARAYLGQWWRRIKEAAEKSKT